METWFANFFLFPPSFLFLYGLPYISNALSLDHWLIAGLGSLITVSRLGQKTSLATCNHLLGISVAMRNDGPLIYANRMQPWLSRGTGGGGLGGVGMGT